MDKYTFRHDADLIAALQGSDEERRKALDFFFQNPQLMSWTLRYVRIGGGSLQDAQDVFEESFLVFERQVRSGHYRSQGTLQAFFHGIVRWQWLAHRRKERATDDLESLLDSPDDNPTPDKIAISDERRVMLSGLIAQIGERCRQLLGLYQLHYSMREIGEQMGFVNEQVAANEVHDCRQKLKKMIQRDSEITDVLKTGS